MTRSDVIDLMRQAKLRLGVHAPASVDEGKLLADFITKDLISIDAKKEEVEECLDRLVRGSFPITPPNVMNSTFFVSLVLKLREIKKPAHAPEEEKERVQITPEQREAYIQDWYNAYQRGGAKWQLYRVTCTWIAQSKGLDESPFIERARSIVERETKQDAKERNVLLAAIKDFAPTVKVTIEAQRMAVQDWFQKGMP